MSPARIVKNIVMLCLLNVCLSYEHCEYMYIYLNVLAGCEDKTSTHTRKKCVCGLIEV